MSLQQYGEKFLEAGGARTRYFDAGDGPPILFLHGGNPGDASSAANAEDWERNFIDLIAAGFRCISIDKLGQGYTDNPQCDEDWSLRGQVAHAASFITALGIGPVHLVGHSRGGYVACRVTLDHPALVISCIIVDSNSCAPGAGRNEIVHALNPHPTGSRAACVHVYEAYSWGSEHITDEWIDLKQKIVDSEKNQAAVARMKKEGLGETVFNPLLVTDREVMFARLREAALPRPALLFWGYNDPTAPVEQGFALFELIGRHQPRCQLHIVNHAGHHSFRERAPEFNRVLAEFCTGVDHGA